MTRRPFGEVEEYAIGVGALALEIGPLPRAVVIERGEPSPAHRAVCSCCHDDLTDDERSGVRIYSAAPVPFDVDATPHVWICLPCASRVGSAAGMVAP